MCDGDGVSQDPCPSDADTDCGCLLDGLGAGVGVGGPVSSYIGAPEDEKRQPMTTSAGKGVGPWE